MPPITAKPRKTTNRSARPSWPHTRSGVKMTAHPNGQWAKRIAGKLKYFGPWADADGALQRYLEHAKPLHDGEDVQTTPSGVVTIADCFNEFLAHRERDVQTERRTEGPDRDRALGPTMFRRYAQAGEAMAEILGRTRPVLSLRPRDFATLKDRLDDRLATPTLSSFLNTIRSVLTWAYEYEMIDRPVRFGPDFRARGLVKAMRRNRRDRGKKLLPAATIRALLDQARPAIRAMTLLGVSGGFYAVDCSDLTFDDVDLDRGVITLARHKTEVDRVTPLWPEVVDAIRAAIVERPAPQEKAHVDRLFITQRGHLWVDGERAKCDAKGRIVSVSHIDNVSQEFRKLFQKAGIERPPYCGFSWLRHTFYTVARRTKDYDAVNAIQGHGAGGMVEHYLEGVALDDLCNVSEYVRRWLYETD